MEKLAQYKVPVAWQEQVDLFALTIRARPMSDADELQPSCFRCQTINPLLNQGGDKCTACGHPRRVSVAHTGRLRTTAL